MSYRLNADKSETTREHHDLDLVDDRGRAVGYLLVVTRCEWDEVEGWGMVSDPAWKIATRPTRDGRPYGSSSNDIHGDTEEDARSQAADRMAAYRKRLARKLSA